MCPECSQKAYDKASEHNRRVDAHIAAGLPMSNEFGVMGHIVNVGTYLPCVHQSFPPPFVAKRPMDNPTLTPEQFERELVERIMTTIRARIRDENGVEPLPPIAEPPKLPTIPVPVAPPWYRDRAFIASVIGMLTAVLTAIGAWLSQASSVDAKRQSEENAAQIKSVHKDVKNANRALGFPASE